jgi:mono/diheme cytochrome c family protein
VRLRVAAPAALAAVLVAAGCGTGGPAVGGDQANGQKLFAAKCGYCHTLAAAGTQGKTGPNLDDAFAYSRKQGFKETSMRDLVLDQIRFAILPMPANIVRGKDADDVAAYVAAVAGNEKAIAAAPPPPPVSGPGGKGASLYSSLGCVGCHTTNGRKGVGPTFKGLYSSKVKLDNGQTVTADETYLVDSIVDPDKQIVDGYAKGVMSSAIKPHQVSQADAKALVDYIKTLK